MLLKIIIYPNIIKEELKNPIKGSVSGTFSMALMSFSLFFLNISYEISFFIWSTGIIIHIILISIFTNNFFFKNFKVENIYASIFVIYVGINNGALTSDDLGRTDIGYIIFLYGFINLIFLFPLILFRYIFYKIPEENKPLILVFNAAVHITIKGYLNTAKIYNKHILVFYSFCFLLYLFSLYKVYEYRNIKFYPSFSAFTFPFVISTKATNGIHNRVLNNLLIRIILYFQLSFSTIIVFYIFILYLRFLIKK
jgi:exfoliative toxin A/B